MLKRFTSHPVASGLIVSALAGVGGVVWASAVDAWPLVWAGLLRAFVFITADVITPRWFFWLLCLLSAVAVVVPSIAWLKSLAPAPEPTWESYRTDVFFNVRWRWGYPVSINELHPFCPKCDYRLVPVGSDHFLHDWVDFECENCDTDLGRIRHSFTETKNKVVLKMDHKIRTGEWRAALRDQPPMLR